MKMFITSSLLLALLLTSQSLLPVTIISTISAPTRSHRRASPKASSLAQRHCPAKSFPAHRIPTGFMSPRNMIRPIPLPS